MHSEDIALTYIDFLETNSNLNHSYYLPYLNLNLNLTFRHHLKNVMIYVMVTCFLSPMEDKSP